jgi:hypothetical protein
MKWVFNGNLSSLETNFIWGLLSIEICNSTVFINCEIMNEFYYDENGFDFFRWIQLKQNISRIPK